MIKKIFPIMFFSLLMPVAAQCADTATDDLFAIDEEDDFLATTKQTRPKTDAPTTTLSEFLMQNITASTALPINKAEKVFCYIVDYAPKGYEGYTVDGLAIKGYCGELSNEGKALIKETLFNRTSLYSKSKADCQVSPRIMLRYVYGIDYTDVLLSLPCPSLTFIHGTNVASMNAAPGEAVFEKIIGAYTSISEDFQSPALLGQMVGSGVPQTQAQKDIIRRNAPTEAPRKKWNTETPTENQPQSEQDSAAPKPATGWNKLK